MTPTRCPKSRFAVTSDLPIHALIALPDPRRDLLHRLAGVDPIGDLDPVVLRQIPAADRGVDELHAAYVPHQDTAPDETVTTVWADTSTEPPTMKGWDGSEWVEIGGGAGGIGFTDNGDGTLTLSAGSYVDNGDGTLTIGAAA